MSSFFFFQIPLDTVWTDIDYMDEVCVCVFVFVCVCVCLCLCVCVCVVKRMVYKAVVLGVLLYGSETWTTKRDATKKMGAFHNRCLRQIVGITSAQQRTELISSVQVACQFGMEESLEDIVIARRLRWLGHLARMDDHRLPKKILFG